MNDTRIKVCGVTQQQDVVALGELGVDYIGFIFVEGSKRQLTAQSCANLLRHMPKTSQSVAVFMNQSLSFIQSVLDVFPANIVQLHGNEPSEFVAQINCPVIQRIHPLDWLKGPQSNKPDNFLNHLIDPGAGNGDTFDWQSYVTELPQTQLADTWLAGGLTPANVKQHIQLLSPSVVDVCSGVEKEKQVGIKSIVKVQELIEQVRNTD